MGIFTIFGQYSNYEKYIFSHFHTMLPSELEEPEYTVQSIIQEAEEMRAILKDIETKGREIMHRHRDAAGINDS